MIYRATFMVADGYTVHPLGLTPGRATALEAVHDALQAARCRTWGVLAAAHPDWVPRPEDWGLADWPVRGYAVVRYHPEGQQDQDYKGLAGRFHHSAALVPA